jgi:PAS domain S-box-containing protein
MQSEQGARKVSAAREREARRQEASFRGLIERMRDGVVVHREGQIVHVNPGALRILGHEREDSLAGRSVLSLVHPDDRAAVARRIARMVATGEPTAAREERLLRYDGSVITAEVGGLAVTFDGAPAIAELVHETTARRLALAEAERQGPIAAGLANEINNQLAYMLLSLERLAAELPKVGGGVAKVRDEIVAVLGEGRTTALFKRAAGAALAPGAIDALLESVHTVTDGARHVGRITRNLMTVARVDEGPRGFTEGGTAASQGGALDGAKRPASPRGSTEAGTRPFQDGALAGAKRPASARRRPDAAPRIEELKPALPASPREAAAPERPPRVLLVDDERTLRTTLAALLADYYDVVLAESGAAAFDILRKDRDFDVILCDLMMPEVSGMEVHAWIERETPELLPRTLFMTGGAFTRNAMEFLEGVPNGCLEKPFEVLELTEVLNRVIDRCASARRIN